MIQGKPYFDYKFLGVESFTKALKQSGVSFLPYEDPLVDTIRTGDASFFTNDDTITLGVCAKDGTDIYFIDFGLLISPNIRSHVVFLYSRKPTLEDVRLTIDDIETLTVEKLETVKKQVPFPIDTGTVN